MHWGKRAKLVKTWGYNVWAGLVLKGEIWRQSKPTKMRVTATRVAPRQLDEANFAAALDKLVIDGLCQPRGRRRHGLGILHDDSPEWLEITYKQRKPADGETPHVVLEIEAA